MTPINLNQIPTEYIMKTKAGKLWKCGKGYRKNWAKLIGKLVLLHNTPYTLINRIKEAGKWYLIFTDGNNNYTERQDKALHNKKLAKDTIVEVPKRVIAGLLPAPKELIDKVVEETQCIISDFRQAYIKKYNEDPHIPHEPTSDGIMAKLKFIFTLGYMGKDKVGDPRYTVYRKELIHYYHPDRGNVTDDIYIRYIKLATDSVERIRKHDMFKLSWYL